MEKKGIILFLGLILATPFTNFFCGSVLFNKHESTVISPRNYISGYCEPLKKAIDSGLLEACQEMIMYDYQKGSANFYIRGMEIFQERVHPICKTLQTELKNVFEFIDSSIEVLDCPAAIKDYSECVEKILATVNGINIHIKNILNEVCLDARLVHCTSEIDRIRRIEKTKNLCKRVSKLIAYCSELEQNKAAILLASDELHSIVVKHFCEHRSNNICCIHDLRAKDKMRLQNFWTPFKSTFFAASAILIAVAGTLILTNR